MIKYDGLIIDAHCDTLSKIYNEKGSLSRNIFHVDINRIKKTYKRYIQVFAIFVEPEYTGLEAFIRANKIIDTFYDEITNINQHVKVCLEIDDIAHIEKHGGTGAILSIEGGTCLNGKVENLEHFYNRGVRMFSLTWNNKNDLACGIIDSIDENLPENEKGLREFGFEILKRINELVLF